MANKVYGFCDAGCKYEVVTKTQFDERNTELHMLHRFKTVNIDKNNKYLYNGNNSTVKLAQGAETDEYGRRLYDSKGMSGSIEYRISNDEMSSVNFNCIWSDITSNTCTGTINLIVHKPFQNVLVDIASLDVMLQYDSTAQCYKITCFNVDGMSIDTSSTCTGTIIANFISFEELYFFF